MIEIKLRISELENRLEKLTSKPKRFRSFNHDWEVDELRGEINGLKWCLNHCFNVHEPNVIEQ